MSEISLKPIERLLLWRLAGAGGGDWMRKITPLAKPSLRKDLISYGLITTAQRKNLDTGRNGTWLELSNAGWKWIEVNMGGEFGSSMGANETLSIVLASLARFLEKQSLSPREVFVISPSEKEDKSSEEAKILPKDGAAAKDLLDLRQRQVVSRLKVSDSPSLMSPMIDASIERAYYQLTHGSPNKRVRLAELRSGVDLSRAEMDAALLRMQSQDKLDLMPLDDPSEITDRDRDAALALPGGPRHLVYLGGVSA